MPTRHPRALLLVSSICLYGCREHGERTASQRLAQSLPATAQQESIRAWSPDSGPIGPERLATDSAAEGSDVEQLHTQGRYIDSVIQSVFCETPQMERFIQQPFLANDNHARFYVHLT